MKITNYEEQPAGGYCIGIFDVYLENMQLTFRKMKICVNKSGTHFLGYPSIPAADDGTGNKVWIPFYEFSNEKKREFEERLFQELGSFVKGPIMRYKAKQTFPSRVLKNSILLKGLKQVTRRI